MIAGGAIGWRSKLQSFVSLSTTEAEFVAAVEAGKKIMWMCNILSEIGYACTTASLLHIDNKSALCVTNNPEHHGRMKQLDLSYFWLREKVEAGVISTLHVPGTEQIADILTKPLPMPKAQWCTKAMGVVL